MMLAICIGSANAENVPQSPSLPTQPPLSPTAENIYAEARPKLLQIRTLLDVAGRQSSLGSGFLVSADGLAVTNYHVVSQHALDPKTYRLEYLTTNGSHGALTLLAIDVINDLAVVRLDKPDQSVFEFNKRALDGGLSKGERVYSMGNPLDLGFTIVEGTYNGLVEKSFNERIHFSGAINAGMSGGPAVTSDGRIVGINVAKQVSGELVSFLVPAHFAAALVERAKSTKPLVLANVRTDIGRQLGTWQDGFYKAIADQGFRLATFGPYKAPESNAAWLNCWAETNADQVPKPRATVDVTNCHTDTWFFIANDLNTGPIDFSHSYVKSVDLNQFQFATFLSQRYQLPWLGSASSKRYTRQRCHEDFVAAADSNTRPPVHTVWCARAYREFEGLYDVSLLVVTQDRSNEALVSRLGMRGVSYSSAVALATRFLGAIQWTK
ncbi:MAG: serine protease [Pseudomonadota bacterium]